jgi:uncharacterized coiled-coil protein SlyX
MSSRSSLAALEERLQLLEMEAAVQRASIAAAVASLSERRTLVWGATAARLGMRLLAIPRVRWLIFGSVLAKLQRRR